MKRLGIVILAAGLGKRMRSKRAKVLHSLCGRPMILHLVETALSLKPDHLVVIVGYQGDEVQGLFKGRMVKVVMQKEQLGTGHAALQAERSLGRFRGDLLILNGDTPLLTSATLQGFLMHYRDTGSALSLMTAILEEPTGYGRVIRDREQNVLRIVEEKDATAGERGIREINAGIYLVEPSFLFPALQNLRNQNVQGEYYLTDVVDAAVESGKRVSAWIVPRREEVFGVNSRLDLSVAEGIVRRRVLERIMEQGVTVLDPSSTYVDDTVVIGQDSILYPSTLLEGKTEIGEGCVIGPQVHIGNSRLANGVVVRNGCVITESVLEDGVIVGPFAHLRPGTILRKRAKIGNFVEVKRSDVGSGSKANHLSYLGDAEIGTGVNIGAGTITCNYDGVRKAKTIIEDGVFVGSDTQFVAPVRVGKGSLIAAGSTITRDIPPDALAISRVPQENKKGWAKKRGSRPKAHNNNKKMERLR